MIKNRFGAFVVVLGVASGMVGCSPKISTTSTTDLVISVAKVKMSLSHEDRKKFDEAFLTVAFRDIRDEDLMDLTKHADEIGPDVKAAITGKTAQQIIAQAEQIKQQRAAQ